MFIPKTTDPARTFSVSFPMSVLDELDKDADVLGNRSLVLQKAYALYKEKIKGKTTL